MEPHLQALFARFEDHFAAGPGLGPSHGTSLLRIDSLPLPFLKHVFRAAAALYRTDPWRRLRPSHLLGLRVGKDSDWSSKKQPFPCAHFLAADAPHLALHLCRSDQDALRMTALRETPQPPNAEILRVVFVPESLLSPSNRRMVRSLSLESSGPDRFPVIDVARCISSGGVRFRNPTMDELRFVYAAMIALALVHPLLQCPEAPKRGRLARFEPFIETVDVQWPPEVSRGWDLVAVTVSHPPGQAYEEKRLGSKLSPMYIEPPPKEDASKSPDLMMQNSGVARQCSMCEKEFSGDQGLCCGRCLAVVYCSPGCQKQHWKDAHKSICGLYKAMMEREEELAMKVFTFPCFVEQSCQWLELMGLHQKGMWRRRCDCYSHCPFGLLPSKGGSFSDSWGGLSNGEYPPDSSFSNGVSNPILLSGWSEYYNLRSLPMSSPVAALLSHPLTVYHILTAISIGSKNRLIKGKEVVVHYLGPAGELDCMPAFGEIGHLLNGAGNIQIVMIGPEVPSNLSGTVSDISRRVRVSLVRGIYQEEAAYLTSPHVVVALNCEMESYGSWGGAFELIKSTNVPAFFTDKSEILCVNAKQALRGAGLHVGHPVTPNPFRSPLRDQVSSNNLPSFSNGFVFGVNT